MNQELTTQKEKQSIRVNRFAYTLYLLLVAFLFIKGDIEWAISNLGIALVFDPFDAKLKWQQRPFYQKAWLIIHLTLTLAGFLYLLLR